MITLNNYEIKILSYLFKRREETTVNVSEIERSTKMGPFKIRRALDSLERKRLIRSLERSRTKPYILTERGRAFAWLASLRDSQIIEIYRSKVV